MRIVLPVIFARVGHVVKLAKGEILGEVGDLERYVTDAIVFLDITLVVTLLFRKKRTVFRASSVLKRLVVHREQRRNLKSSKSFTASC